jgi:hypothetical protein
MILGHDLKYSIPEMDLLLGAAADMGIFFERDSEKIAFPDGRKCLYQIVMGKIGETDLTVSINTYDVHKREEVTI